LIAATEQLRQTQDDAIAVQALGVCTAVLDATNQLRSAFRQLITRLNKKSHQIFGSTVTNNTTFIIILKSRRVRSPTRDGGGYDQFIKLSDFRPGELPVFVHAEVFVGRLVGDNWYMIWQWSVLSGRLTSRSWLILPLSCQ
jgi:hypothetical protein